MLMTTITPFMEQIFKKILKRTKKSRRRPSACVRKNYILKTNINIIISIYHTNIIYFLYNLVKIVGGKSQSARLCMYTLSFSLFFNGSFPYCYQYHLLIYLTTLHSFSLLNVCFLNVIYKYQ